MSTEAWFAPLNDCLQRIADERKGQMVRRAGVLSTETEITFHHGSWPAVYGFEVAVPGGGARLSLYVRIARAPATAEPAVEYVGLPAKANLPAPAGNPETRPTLGHPGFHLDYERPANVIDRFLQQLFGARTRTDPQRRGWLRLQSGVEAHFERHLAGPLARDLVRFFHENGPDHLTAIITPFVFKLRMRPLPTDEALLYKVLNDSLQLIDTVVDLYPAQELISEDMEELAAPMSIQSGWCGICGEEAVQRAVKCGRCRAPHHKECWNWVGRCSIFGCGSRNFVL